MVGTSPKQSQPTRLKGIRTGLIIQCLRYSKRETPKELYFWFHPSGDLLPAEYPFLNWPCVTFLPRVALDRYFYGQNGKATEFFRLKRENPLKVKEKIWIQILKRLSAYGASHIKPTLCYILASWNAEEILWQRLIEQTRFTCLGRKTSLGEGKNLNSNPQGSQTLSSISFWKLLRRHWCLLV